MRDILPVVLLVGCSTVPPAPRSAQIGSAPPLAVGLAAASTPAQGPHYTATSELLPPTDYRSWTFLTSGFAMAYGPAARILTEANVKAMDNVYVNRTAYDAFLQTGSWPEGTMFVLEVRTAEGTGSIVSGGHFQTTLSALEVHIKDSQRFAGGSGFFEFAIDAHGPTAPAKLLPRAQACYDCHTKHGAVGDTFTQFYPTLFPVARAKGTVRADFVGIPATGDDLMAAFASGGWPAAHKLLDVTAARWPDANLVREAPLNTTAYRLLMAGKQPEALALFEYVTGRYPASANAWDSLSEAYESAGRIADAAAATDRGLSALAADPRLAAPRRAPLSTSLRERKARMEGKAGK